MRVGWRGALGILLSVALLWWTLRDQDLRAVWTVLEQSSALLWIACAVFATAIFPLRARRWAALLEPVAGRLPFRSLWQSTAVGMMVNNVAPARAGEFARAFALSRAEPRVKFTAAFASLAVDRLFFKAGQGHIDVNPVIAVNVGRTACRRGTRFTRFATGCRFVHR